MPVAATFTSYSTWHLFGIAIENRIKLRLIEIGAIFIFRSIKIEWQSTCLQFLRATNRSESITGGDQNWSTLSKNWKHPTPPWFHALKTVVLHSSPLSKRRVIYNLICRRNIYSVNRHKRTRCERQCVKGDKFPLNRGSGPTRIQLNLLFVFARRIRRLSPSG